MPIIVQVKNLTKTYRNRQTPAIDNLSIEVQQGEIFGLLGPNGAGKTTTISILCGILSFQSGSVHFLDRDLIKDIRSVKKMIGLVPQDIALYPSLTVYENLYFFGQLSGLQKSGLSETIMHNLEILGLEKNTYQKISTFSGGMKRRANLAAGMLHKPQILFLDEPTAGIDVQSKNVILDYLRSLNTAGTTIIYTSHDLTEAEQFCRRVAIIDNGTKVVEGVVSELIQQRQGTGNLEALFLELTGRELRD